jgi:hypothetical protein
MPPAPFQIGLEIGSKRTFAAALDWPGWCRSGRDEAAALNALLAYAPRYARAVASARLAFRAPKGLPALHVIERQSGNATTDFGAPDAIFSSDALPFTAAILRRYTAILTAAWRTLDAAAEAALGHKLSKGPRGGGRDLDKIVEHCWGGEAGYVNRLGGKVTVKTGAPPAETLAQVHQALLDGLAAALRGEIAEHGPRGGKRWTPRRAVRRAAWHILDHAWEIEDRL